MDRAEIDGLDGPGVYGGSADERIATEAEHARLRAAGWSQTAMKTLWIAPPSYGGGFHSVDEAISEVDRAEGIPTAGIHYVPNGAA